MMIYNENTAAANTNRSVESTPVADTTSTSTFDTLPTIDTSTVAPIDDNDNVPGFLPKDYLAHGYLATTDKGAKYLRPEFVGEYAEIMAKLLADMKPREFKKLLKELKRSKKTSLPFEARLTAALELIPKALALVYSKKAPPLLLSFIKDNVDHIHNDDDWNAFYRHLEAIFAYLTKRGGEA